MCRSCGSWVATVGDQCETCSATGDVAAVVSAAVAWRWSMHDGPDPVAYAAACDALADAVDRMMGPQ